MTGNETCIIGINLSIFSYAQDCFVNPLEVFFFLFSFSKLAIVKVAPSNRYFCFVLRYSTPVMTLLSVVLSSSFSYVDQIITFECDVVLYKEPSPSLFKFALVFVFGISVCFHKGNSVNSTMTSYSLVVLLILELLSFSLGSQQLSEHSFKLSSEETDSLRVVTQPVGKGTRWAVLIAGSYGYENYRHQADVCHAYQILRKGGLKDENIIVFMYDDIAFSEYNPRPGIIINRPQGEDVYEGVPKDYTGRNASINNLFAVILANKTALTGGSGKVLDTGSEDHIFIYYTDHGSPGMVGMPADEILYASDLIDVLKKKHDSNTFKSMVFYLEACDSGSMFEGLLPEGLNIYATTASNSAENSFATYCPDDNPDVESYGTCLGDLYSVSWMEDSDHNDLRKETLDQQYEVVRRRTANGNKVDSSHVMKYGNTKLGKNSLYSYFGSSPTNDNYTFITHDSSTISKAASQRDAELLHFWHKFHRAPWGSKKKLAAEKQLRDEINHRVHIDESMMSIAKILFRSEKSLMMLETIRPAGQPLVDDWNCFKAFVRTYEEHCGLLSRYGRRYARAIANMCNAGVKVEQMAMASATACHA